MQRYLKAFTFMSIVFLFQGCGTFYLVQDEGKASFHSNYTQCVNDMDATYSKFPIDMNRAYVFKESAGYDYIRGETSITVKPHPVTGPFPPIVEKKKAPDRTVEWFAMRCVVDNVDLNHNKRLLEVQRCLENRCMASFNEEDWWPDDRMESREENNFSGILGAPSESWAISKLEVCASCRFSEAKLLAEGGHDSNFVARKLDGFKSPNPFSSRSKSPLYGYVPEIFRPGLMEGYTPVHMFDNARKTNFTQSSMQSASLGIDVSHLREIIFCDPVTDETFYITDTPVLASD